jgi:hypothetical protein
MGEQAVEDESAIPLRSFADRLTAPLALYKKCKTFFREILNYVKILS